MMNKPEFRKYIQKTLPLPVIAIRRRRRSNLLVNEIAVRLRRTPRNDLLEDLRNSG